MANYQRFMKLLILLLREGVPICYLKCTAIYPTHPKDVNAKSIKYLRELFGCEVGLSDHTLGIELSISAVTLGASL